MGVERLLRAAVLSGFASMVTGCASSTSATDVVDADTQSDIATHDDDVAEANFDAGFDGDLDAEAGLPECTLEADGGCTAVPATGVCCPLSAWRYDETDRCLRPYGGSHMTFACEAQREGCGGSPALGCYVHALADGGSEIIVAPNFFDRSVVERYELIPCEAGNYASAAPCP